jgi:hypothetical protein
MDWTVSSATAAVTLALGIASVRWTRSRLYFYL